MQQPTKGTANAIIPMVIEVPPASDNRSLRYRINIAISVKGQKTWEVTCDGQGYTMEEILERSDEIVKQLELRYPMAGIT